MLRRLIALLPLFVPLSSRSFAAAPDQPWTMDSIMNLRSVSDPELTADGSKVAYVVSSVDAARNSYSSQIWVASLNNSRPWHLAAREGSESYPRWSPDGKSLAFLSHRGGAAQIYLCKSVSSAPDAPAQKITHFATGIIAFKWSPDGRRIGYLAADPGPVRDPIVAGEGYEPVRLHVINPDGSGDHTVTAQDRHLLSFDWSPDGARVVYAAQASPQGRDAFHVDIYETELASGAEKPVVVQPGQDLAPAYSPDGKWIAFYSQRGTTSYFGERGVGVVAVSGGPIRYVTDKLDGDVFGGATRFWWSSDGKRLIFGAGRGTDNYLYSVEVESGRSKRLTEVLTANSAFSVSRDGTRVAWVKSTTGAPGDVYLLDSKTSREVKLSDANPEVRECARVSAQTVRWKSRDGMEVEGVLRLPFDYHEGRSVPLLTILHGGPTGAALESFPIPRTYPTQLFLQAGYAVFEPNFRGSINYGAKYRLPTIERQGIGDMGDILSGIDSLVARGIADPDRLGVMGWSYGGYLSVWIVGHSQRFKAASIGACTTDWVSWYAPSIANKESAPEVMWEYFGGKPWDRLDVYSQHSPRAFLKYIKTPSIVLHGENDIDSGPEVYVALRDLGVPVAYVTYPREGHGFTEPKHQRDLMRRNLEWFEKWISVH